jgi:ADP-ribose pyrophosphatase
MPFETIRSETAYRGRAFSVRSEHLRLPDGRETRLDIVDHVGSIVILPVDADGNVLFVRQYRHPTGKDLLELPAGTLEPGEQPDACAQRELREETGMSAEIMEPLGGFFLAPGYSTEFMHVFLARGLRHNPLQADSDEFLSVERIPLSQVLSAGLADLLPDAKSLAALMLARDRLE